jgi:hypothetical protein
VWWTALPKSSKKIGQCGTGHHRLERPQTNYECGALTPSAGHSRETPARGPCQFRFARRRRPLPGWEVWCKVGHARRQLLDCTRGGRERAPTTRTVHCSASFGGSSGRPDCALNGRRAARLSDFSTTFLRARDWPVGNIETIDGRMRLERKSSNSHLLFQPHSEKSPRLSFIVNQQPGRSFATATQSTES